MAGMAKASNGAEEVRVEKIDIPLLVLYGSDSGRGETVAELFQKKAEARGVKEVRCMEADKFDVNTLGEEPNVLFIMSTAGQGEFCENAKHFWSKIQKSAVHLHSRSR
jgi:sulfite reductase (NADPH) hemoprotein beta-component